MIVFTARKMTVCLFWEGQQTYWQEIGLIVDWLRQDYYEPSGKTALLVTENFLTE